MATVMFNVSMTRELPPLDPELAATLDEIPDEYLLRNLIDFDDLPASRQRMNQVMELTSSRA